ncbi:MAG TPA: acyl-CoA desaturase [Chitinophagales bacterium]|nr:acyl-CoA desaturase [Chitinophagales bacterium]
MAPTIRFTNPRKTNFHRVVSKRVDAYFKDNNISMQADYRMVIKTLVMFGLYFIPYFLIVSGKLPLWAMWLGTAVMGLGLAGIGMSVMHDANHGAYSKKRWLNRLLGYSLDIVGGNSDNWRIQHNQQHHTFTNIHGHDYDIRERMRLRFTPAIDHKPVHRFMMLYVFVLYALQTFFWVLLKDFANFFQYVNENKDGLSAAARVKRFMGMLVAKLFYVFYLLVVPVLVLHLAWWQILIGFLTLHVVAGFILTVVFQLAHVVENTWFPEPDMDGNVEEEWAIHQMRTTVNFAPKSRLITFYVGGLNYQVEHHLFQRICHVHYPAIAPIVKQTAEEFGVPYLSNETFGAAFASHVRLLKKLSFNEVLHTAMDM